jgi:SAM-dependent methyltransferase
MERGSAGGKMNVSNYDQIARGVNAPIYDYYARKIKEKTGIAKGVCLDAGSGGGYLGLALAKITELDFIFLDISADALEKAKLHICEEGLEKRAKALLADVHRIPLARGSVNLAVSRGSTPFWKDPALALKEIYRVLAPGGMAYVGGGRGTPEMQALIKEDMVRLGINWRQGPGPGKTSGKRWAGRLPERDYDPILKSADIPTYEAKRGDDGMWIHMWK